MIISIGHKLNVCRPSAQRKMTLLFIALVIQEDVRTELAFIRFTNYNELIRKSDQENTFQLPFSFNVIDSDLRRYPQSLVTIIGLLNDKYYQIINALARLWPLELSRVQKAQGSTFSGGLSQIMQCLVSIIS